MSRDELTGAMVLETHLDRRQGEGEESYWPKRGWHIQSAPGQYDDDMTMCEVRAGGDHVTYGRRCAHRPTQYAKLWQNQGLLITLLDLVVVP